MPSFVEYVCEHMLQEHPNRIEPFQKVGKHMNNAIEKYWQSYYDYATQHQPAKKQKTDNDGEYSNTKFSRDAKQIVTKLQNMEPHVTALNQDDTLESVTEMFRITRQMYKRLQAKPEPEPQETLPPSGALAPGALPPGALPPIMETTDEPVVEDGTTKIVEVLNGVAQPMPIVQVPHL